MNLVGVNSFSDTKHVTRNLSRIFIAGGPGSNNMKTDYWDVTDEQVIEKTGKKIAEWIKILDAFKAADKKSNEVVAHLQAEYSVPRYWARTLTTHYLKSKQ